MSNQVKVTLFGAGEPRTTQVNPDAESRERAWTRIASSIGMNSTPPPDITPNPEPPASPVSTPEPTTPIATTINLQEVLAKANGVLSITDDAPPAPEPITDNALGDSLTALLKETDKYFPERHFEYPLLYDPTGRPVMAVANADNFLGCQELVQNPTDPRAWHHASKTAARRSSHHSGSMDEVIKYIVLAAHCWNHATRLESREVS